jgi:hypothetical protein
MVAEATPQSDPARVTATAVASDGWWLVCLAGAPEINVRVRRLVDVDAAMGKVLASDLRRDEVDVRVHIRWYDAHGPTT